ncbi:MAG: diaminopimelate decarboxylase [Bradymonadia bacterium]|jgi:diaminopimelate decarboxylase
MLKSKHEVVRPALAGSDWWCRPGLRYIDDRLVFAGHDVEALTKANGGMVMAYDGQRIRERISSVRASFEKAGGSSQMYFALKSNRFRPVVDAIRAHGGCGIDACSPRELALALDAGFSPREISFTGSALSEQDVDAIVGHDVTINVNSISTIHKIGHRGTRRPIGLRINPQIGIGATSSLVYAGETPTKFGIYPERIPEAMRLAKSYGLEIEGVHMHVGSGWMADGMPTFMRALERMLAIAEPLGALRYVNVGGGIGVTHSARCRPVDLDAYAAGVTAAVRSRFGGATVCCEPGDYLVNDSALLGATVAEVEEKGGALFVGLNVGFNSNPQAAHYGFVPEVVHTTRGPAGPNDRKHAVTGNINEVVDMFNAGARLPDVHEGDVLAVLSAGGYGSSMASDHCMRERAAEVMIRA